MELKLTECQNNVKNVIFDVFIDKNITGIVCQKAIRSPVGKLNQVVYLPYYVVQCKVRYDHLIFILSSSLFMYGEKKTMDKQCNDIGAIFCLHIERKIRLG